MQLNTKATMPRVVNLQTVFFLATRPLKDVRETACATDLPGWERPGGLILARQVEEILDVGRGVAHRRHIAGAAGVEVVLGDDNRLLEIHGRLHKGCHQARRDVPLDVAVE